MANDRKVIVVVGGLKVHAFEPHDKRKPVINTIAFVLCTVYATS